MTKVTQVLGAYGEQRAADHLAGAGLLPVDRNWRCSLGEIDLVARDGEVVVFCEVKTRRGDRYGDPLEAVHPRKVARLRRLAEHWLAVHGDPGTQVRFDVVGVLVGAGGRARVDHVRGAF